MRTRQLKPGMIIDQVIKDPTGRNLVVQGQKTAAKKEAVTTVVLQYAGREVFEQDIMARAKADWVAAGHKEGDLKEITLYIKPEENVAYYVANGIDTGSFSY